MRISDWSSDVCSSDLVRLAANLWHIAFSILVVVDFTGLVYNGLLVGETRFASLAVGSFLVLSLTPFAVGGYGALIDDLMLSRGEDGRHRGAAGALKAFGQGVILLARSEEHPSELQSLMRISYAVF